MISLWNDILTKYQHDVNNFGFNDKTRVESDVYMLLHQSYWPGVLKDYYDHYINLPGVVDIAVFFSFKKAKGLGWHRDEESVFIQQLWGETSYIIKAPSGKYTKQMKPGDSVFIDSEWSHQCITNEMPRAALSIYSMNNLEANKYGS